MANTVFKIFILVTVINLMMVMATEVWMGQDATGRESMNNELAGQQYHIEQFRSESDTQNLQTEGLESEATVLNSMKASRSFWDILMNQFESLRVNETNYDNNIEISLAYTLNWLRGILLLVNALLLFLILKNKFSG